MIPAGPRFATPRTDRPTYGGEVAKLARLLGFEPMPHQRLFWDNALEHEQGRSPTARSAGRSPGSGGRTVALLLLIAAEKNAINGRPGPNAAALTS
jgi:hypothetical protein